MAGWFFLRWSESLLPQPQLHVSITSDRVGTSDWTARAGDSKASSHPPSFVVGALKRAFCFGWWRVLRSFFFMCCGTWWCCGLGLRSVGPWTDLCVSLMCVLEALLRAFCLSLWWVWGPEKGPLCVLCVLEARMRAFRWLFLHLLYRVSLHLYCKSGVNLLSNSFAVSVRANSGAVCLCFAFDTIFQHKRSKNYEHVY